jgi:hypothetical protein
MSLWPIKTVTGIMEYELCQGNDGFYNAVLCTPPRIYRETLLQLASFFYEPSNDHLVGFMTFQQKAWPGWGAWRYEWSAETGEFIKRTWCGIWPIAYPKHAGLGSYNKIFCVFSSGPQISDVPWDTLYWADGTWLVDTSTWVPEPHFVQALVNLQDNLVVGVKDWNLEVWDISGTPTLIKALRLPNTLGYLCMESREICWVITKDGLILKANYKDPSPRWEMLSSVQPDDHPDTYNFLMTWDPKRGRLVVLRQRHDAEDGANQCQFEFYRPLVKIIGMTDPVPVNRHRAGDLVEFVAHLYGNAGEGVTPYRVIGSLVAPAQGTLLRAEASSAVNGAVSLLYQAPAESGEDTLILAASINDGAL